jgi:hypothetical protein
MRIRDAVIFKLIMGVSFFFSCSGPQPVVDIAVHHWPEGSSVSLIRNGKVTARSALFGEHVRVTLPRRGEYRIRVSSPEALTAMSPEMEIGPGVTAYTLPLPVMRRRIGATNLGIGFEAPGSDSACIRILDTTPASFTSISLDLGVSRTTADLVRRAHEKGIEVLLRGGRRGAQNGKSALKSILALTDSAERYGADGIVFVPDAGKGYGRGLVPDSRTLAAAIHERGMTFSLALDPGDSASFRPLAFFDSIPAPECPDDLVLLCGTPGAAKDESSPVSIARIENALIRVMDARIPLSRVTVEIPLSANAYSGSGPNRTPVVLSPGALRKTLAEAGEIGGMRLGDGTLALGFRGVNYSWDDPAGIAKKVEFLRTGEFARVRGVRIVWDGLGVSPDSDGLKRLAGVFMNADANAAVRQ